MSEITIAPPTSNKRLIESAQPTRKETISEALDSLYSEFGYRHVYTLQSYINRIAPCGFNKATIQKAIVAFDIIYQMQPLTLRMVFYRVVSAGLYSETSDANYAQISNIVLRLRRRSAVAYDYIIDNIRKTQKPSSWSGLQEYSQAVSDSYRKCFWTYLPQYIEIICEKDALSGVLYPVTEKYDVPLQVIRGNASDSFANSIAESWKRIEKPIKVYYVGDHDVNGIDMERDMQERLAEYSGKSFKWERLALTHKELISGSIEHTLKAKRSDKRAAAYIDKYGDIAAEVDALAPEDLRNRVENAILSHIDMYDWQRLQAIEDNERDTFKQAFSFLTIN